jgi:mono/diheme cytochrome c family protein
MNYRYLIGAVLCLLVGGVIFADFRRPATPLTESTSVESLRLRLGADPAPHYPDPRLADVDLGRGIVLEGLTLQGRQSKHFVCTSCHNVVVEDPDLSRPDPAARLQYATENELPFLPGTTFYGIVNRRSFYNGDYELKYGDLVDSARHDLRQAIQLCATECAQGRALNPVELESTLAFLWQLELQLGDLHLTESEQEELNTQLAARNNPRGLALLEAHYQQASPATFVEPPVPREAGYPGITGRPEMGRAIYERSCLHCHEAQRYSFFNLDNSPYSFDFLTKHLPQYTRYSMYQVVRYGTSPIPGKRAYMPHYTAERMSNQQVEDLGAYLKSRAAAR